MHFYEFNIGDFAKKTQHLTNEEELAYRRALDLYYDTEKPLDVSNIPSLSRRLRVGFEALKNVLDEFFPEGINKHADEKINAYHAFLNRQQANGRKGGRPKNQEDKTQNNPLVLEKNPVPSQPLTTKPLTTKPNINTMSSQQQVADRVPYQAIVDLYHSILPELPKCMSLSAKRRGYISSRWKNKEHLPDLETWQEYFEFVRKSNFLMGKVQPNGDRKKFVADLEWLSNESNFIKTWENKYHG